MKPGIEETIQDEDEEFFSDCADFKKNSYLVGKPEKYGRIYSLSTKVLGYVVGATFAFGLAVGIRVKEPMVNAYNSICNLFEEARVAENVESENSKYKTILDAIREFEPKEKKQLARELVGMLNKYQKVENNGGK